MKLCAVIVWRPSIGNEERVLTGFYLVFPSEYFDLTSDAIERHAFYLALAYGWTPPRWWQWWRWNEEKRRLPEGFMK
jgi:hypothetical protein